ncbi:ileal sodium/bile acid cotransporter-like [Lytechinus variegatus]|uniref:ileal sodium/bile acid cotransporter-like n=1 Tax=Lytechinus variegatus TaxID=7654 RepID=UPI001BB1B881|nr:ileal sodium/bile acid cotransporter-like [Lytechinus variegatus]XP_041464094.1 ileal sodium/bile acid cotransporter-like [Lytechinus variegatus]
MELETETFTVMVTTMMDVAGNETAPSNIETIKLATKVINIFILAFLMISMGCTIDLKDFKDTFRHPAGFFVGMLCQFVLMPLIAFCLGLAFRLESAGALSLLILACCPGGTLSNLFTYWTEGDVCLSVCMTAVSTAVAIGMMPLNLFIYTRVWTDDKAVIPYVNIVTTLITILIPVVFGVFLRWWKKELTKYVTRVGIIFSFMCIIAAFALSFILNPTFLHAVWQLWFCAASLPLLGYFLGYGIAFLLRQPHKKSRTIAFETGSQNVSLAMTLTVVSFANSPLFFDMLFYPSLYACFIYIDSFVVIGIYKAIVYCKSKNDQFMDMRVNGFDVVPGDEVDADDDDEEDIENHHDVSRNEEKRALQTVSVNNSVVRMGADGDKYQKM